MATKRFKNNKWRYTVKRSKLLDKPINLSFENEAEGDAYVAKLEAKLDQGIIPDGFKQEASSKPLGDAIDEYLSRSSISDDDRSKLSILNRRYYNVPLEQVNYHWAENLVLSLKRELNRSPSTIRKHVGALARCLDWALAKGYIKINPFRLLPKGYAQYTEEDGKYGQIREDVEKDRRFEDFEEQALRDALNDLCDEKEEMTLLFELGVETAMRLSEIYTLSWDQIDLGRNTIFLDKTKNGDKRQVPLTSVARLALENYPRQVGKLFPWGPKSKTVTSRLSKRFGRICRDLGIKGFGFHCLRHEATSRLFEKTDLLETEIMKITGHRGTRVLARYANLRASNLAQRLW